ncbi:general odorant-binding protein 1-like [Trichoplusia ni]|uniref:General odorant-binding protein 1-like n=1 Tax=Trichoplusia ni TaxID=7111 RepID=A0A7E5WAC0_TRINI|nr:general odorant-binding protein 1-like [Trichoplusia ni]
MADSRWRVLCFVCAALLSSEVLASKVLMTKMTTGFTEVVDQCRKELNLGESVLQDMYYFWREEYQLLDRNFGCLVLCMSEKLDLVGDDKRLHHGRTAEFAKTHGASDDIAQKLVTMLHECEKVYHETEDQCVRVLDVSKCFKTKIHELNWAPNMENLMEEVMTAA